MGIEPCPEIIERFRERRAFGGLQRGGQLLVAEQRELSGGRLRMIALGRAVGRRLAFTKLDFGPID